MFLIPSPFVVEKYTALYMSVLVCSVGAFVYAYTVFRQKETPPVLLRPSVLLLSLWLLWALVASLPSLPVLYVLSGGVSVFYYVLAVNLFRSFSPDDFRPALRAVCCMLLFHCSYIVWQLAVAVREGMPTAYCSGFFDNVAGPAASCALLCPVLLYAALREHRMFRRAAAFVVCAVFAGMTVVLQSRSAVLALLLACACAVALYAREVGIRIPRRKVVVTFFAVFLSVFFVCAYLCKKDSADGRLLVYRCTLSLIARSPWTGHGVTGFKAGYMDEQAAYFRTHPDSAFVPLADNLRTPLNDYLLWLVDYGLVGMLPLLLLGWHTCVSLRRHPSADRLLAAVVLLSVGIMALFSYPMSYTFVQWAVLTALAWIHRNESPLVKAAPVSGASVVLLVASGLFLGGLLCRHIRSERQWERALAVAEDKGLEKAVPCYARLLPDMHNHPDFLYNYIVLLNGVGSYKQCDSLLSSYVPRYGSDVCLTLVEADNARHSGDFVRAESCLWKAHYMAPVRFIPLYRLFRLYVARNDSARALGMARMLVEKPVKIPSEEIDWIKDEAKGYCSRPHSAN